LFSYFYFLLEPLDDELFKDDSELEPLPLLEEDEPLPDEELPDPLPDDELPLNEPDEDEPLTCLAWLFLGFAFIAEEVYLIATLFLIGL